MALEGSFALELDAKQISGGLDEFKGALRRAALRALVGVANELLTDSRPYVPVLTGDLLRTGRVEVIENPLSPNDTVRVRFGNGDDVIYAEIQHEEEFNHPSLGFRGAAKYLERPFNLNARFYAELFGFLFARYAGI